MSSGSGSRRIYIRSHPRAATPTEAATPTVKLAALNVFILSSMCRRGILLCSYLCVCVCACVAVCLCQDITRFRFSFTTFCYYFVFCSTPAMYFFQFAGVFFCFMCKKKISFYLAFLCPSVCMCACLLLLLFRALLLEFPFRARHFAAAFHSSCCYLPVQQTWP